MNRYYHTTLTLAALAALAACSTLPPGGNPASSGTGTPGTCTLTPGTAPGTLYTGKFIPSSGQAQQGGVFFDQGVIKEVGEGATMQAKYAQAAQLQCRNAYLSPGFINPHEHTSYSYGFPDPGTNPGYAHRDEWRMGLGGKYKIVQPVPTSVESILAWIELRHLMTGVTTIAGSGAAVGWAKNVGSAAGPAYEYLADLATFPFGPKTMQDFAVHGCKSDAQPGPQPYLNSRLKPDVPYVAHVGEGRNCEARLELDFFLRYVGTHPGRKYSIIHGVALEASHLDAVKKNRVSVVWSPRSNLALYGATVDGAWLLDNGVSVALGTDWSPSGSYHMLGEMQCAAAYSQAKSKRSIQGAEFWAMLTGNAAASLGLEGKTGAIATGLAADLVVLNDPDGRDLSAFASLQPADVLAVVVDGRLVTGKSKAVQGSGLHASCQLSAGPNFVCMDESKSPFTFEAMKAANQASVDLFSLDREAACKF